MGMQAGASERASSKLGTSRVVKEASERAAQTHETGWMDGRRRDDRDGGGKWNNKKRPTGRGGERLATLLSSQEPEEPEARAVRIDTARGASHAWREYGWLDGGRRSEQLGGWSDRPLLFWGGHRSCACDGTGSHFGSAEVGCGEV